MKIKEEKQIDFVKFVPTMMSLMALCFGITAINFSYSGKFVFAVSFVLFACFLDGIDGRVARFLKVSSNFGAEIDSLADLVNFGVAPGFIVYCWKMNEFCLRSFSWFAVLLLACCMTIRLARFNVDLTTKDQNDPLVKYFFKGIPAPAAAGLVLLPMILNFQFGFGFFTEPLFVVINTIIVALLAGGTLPTPCFKKIKISDKYKNLVLIFASIFIILFIIRPWLSLSLLGLIYVASIVVGILVFLKFKNEKNISRKNA